MVSSSLIYMLISQRRRRNKKKVHTLYRCVLEQEEAIEITPQRGNAQRLVMISAEGDSLKKYRGVPASAAVADVNGFL